MSGRICIHSRLIGLLLAGCLYLSGGNYSFAQEVVPERCGIDRYEKWQAAQPVPSESESQFESWIARRIAERRNAPLSYSSLAQVVTLPVVVHVIHNGEPPGVGTNIPDEQILSQIEVLNEDFRRMNGDRDNTPADFLPVASDTEIQFALAQRDPEGLPTTGIIRVNGGQDIWEISENYRMKQLSNWPPEDYINIWVTNMGSNYLGYAQFPVSPLEGLELGSAHARTDGIVADYMVFGSEAIYPDANLIAAYNLGRTTSHEMGHFLGLRHIWGDGGCEKDDYVNDTPLAANDHGGLGIPCSYPGPNTCNTGASDLPDMFQNYMDYTNDVCMNLFTQGQKDRMRVVLDSSPRRQSLVESSGALPPVQVALDAGIRSIPGESGFLCSDVTIPEVEIRNYGTETVSQVTLRLLIDNATIENRTFSVSLDPLEIRTLTFNPVSISSLGEHEFEFIIESVNGSPDQNVENDVRAYTAVRLPDTEGPLNVDFENGLPANWTIVNPDELIGWQTVSAFYETATNRALYINHFDYELEGEPDLFISPVIDLTDAAGPYLTFDLSHARYPGNDDGLLITATNLCGDPILQSDTVYYKTGRALATISDTRTQEFFPESAADWRTETVNLSAYAGTQVRLSFISLNGYGNNLFIDNLHFDPGAVISLKEPGLVVCGPDVPLTFTIQNNLSNSISSFDLALSVGGSASQFQVFLNPPLQPGETRDFSLDPASLPDGAHLVEAEVSNINDSGIKPPGLNSISRYIYVYSSEDLAPLLENFDQDIRWIFASRDGNPAWSLTQTNFNNSATLNFRDYDDKLPLQWIVSPDIDLTGIDTPWLSLEYAYFQQTSDKDQLLVYVSTDCGTSYEVLTSVTLEALSGNPAAEDDWSRAVIPLEILAGEPNVRVALVAESREAGILYIDNIQLFVNEPLVFAEQAIYPNPSRNGRFNITVNLETRQDARLRIINMQGQVVRQIDLYNVLNQTYPVDMSNEPQGIYIVELRGETFSLIKRVMNRH